MKIVLQVHDEIVVAVPKESGEVMEAKLVEIMSTPPKWAAGLPVACEAGRADNYGDT
jgi:DNA polymerase